MGKAIRILRGVGLLLCGLSVVLAVAQPTSGQSVALNVLLPWQLSGFQNEMIGVLVPVVIAAMFWRSTTTPELESPSRLEILLLALQTVLAFLVAEELQFVVAVEAGLLLSTRIGALWIFGQAAAAWLISAFNPTLVAWVTPNAASRAQRLMDIGILMLIAMLYNFLAYSLGLLAAMEGRQRRALALSYQELETVNRQLQEAQRGVAEGARLNERLRLARELHDAIGHQLSALSINLQIASRVSQDQARRPVLEAYQLVGVLLSDVRAVVSSTRETEITDLSSALRAIANRVPEPVIHLDLDPSPISMESEIGHALFRCAQEIITNAVRHSAAANIWIATRATSEELILTAWDDGKGNPGLVIGNGLRGMEERIRECGGSCVFHNRYQAGFEANVRAPLTRKAARAG